MRWHVRLLRAARRYWKVYAGCLLSLFLLVGSLYQLEICYIWIMQDKPTFEFPFFIWQCNVHLARDIFYLGIVASWIVLFLTLWYAED